MKHVFLWVLVFFLVGCGRNLLTGQVIAEPACQDIQVAYMDEVPVQKTIEVEREEVQFEPKPYSEEACSMQKYSFVVQSEQASGWSSSKPYCVFAVKVFNQENEQGDFTVVSKYTLNGLSTEQKKTMYIPPQVDTLVEFLAPCGPSDDLSFDHASIISPEHKVCSMVTKFRSNPVTRKVKGTDIVTQMEKVEKYRVERQCT